MVDLFRNPLKSSQKTLESSFEGVGNPKIKNDTTQIWDQPSQNIHKKKQDLNITEKEEDVFGEYSSLSPIKSRGVRKFIIGGLGIGKSSLINLYKFDDLMVLQTKFKYVVDIPEELKIQLNKESIIVHANFIEYVGETIERVEKTETGEKFFEILIYGAELDMPKFEIILMDYVKGIAKLIENMERFSQGKVIWEEALERFEIVVTKAYILWNRATIREKFEETLKYVNDFETDEFKLKKYRKILGYFAERTEKIFLFFTLDKEGSYNEIIRGYD